MSTEIIQIPKDSNVYPGLRTMEFMRLYNHFLHNFNKSNN